MEIKKPSFSDCAYKPLTDGDIRHIHAASMRVFETVGVKVCLPRALAIFRAAGADVDEHAMIVKADEDWVMRKLAAAPERVVLCGRDERYDLDLSGFNVYMGTGGTALNVLDLNTGERRPSSLRDLEHAARLTDALKNIDFFVLSCYPNEIEKNDADVNRFYAAFKNTSKHVMGGVYTPDGVRNVAQMAAAVAGGYKRLIERPFVSFITCIMSPLLMDRHYTELLLTAVETGLPLATPVAPMAGSTSPATLAGTLVQMNVEALAGVLLAQCHSPGHPVLYSCVPTTMDLRYGSFCFGSVEMGLMNAACAQLSRFYNLPNYTTAGVSESKLPDAQSGYESMCSVLMCALSGCNFIHDAAGLIESGLTISYEQYVLDDDILGMCRRAARGIAVNADALAEYAIRETGPGGNFLAHDHTLTHMRDEFFYPNLTDRNNYTNWAAGGAKDSRALAADLAREILAGHRPAGVPADVERRLLDEIPGLRREWM